MYTNRKNLAVCWRIDILSPDMSDICVRDSGFPMQFYRELAPYGMQRDSSEIP